MKRQQKGVGSMKVRAPVTIKLELVTENPPLLIIKKHYHIFIVVNKLLDMVHMDQTSVLPIILQ